MGAIERRVEIGRESTRGRWKKRKLKTKRESQIKGRMERARETGRERKRRTRTMVQRLREIN